MSLAVADSAFAYFTAKGTYGDDPVTDVGWPLGFALLALAAVHAAGEATAEAGQPPAVLVAAQRLAAVPPADPRHRRVREQGVLRRDDGPVPRRHLERRRRHAHRAPDAHDAGEPRAHRQPRGDRGRAPRARGAAAVPGVPRPAHAARQPGPVPGSPRPRAGAAAGRDGVGALRRPRRLQDGERQPRSRHGRPPARVGRRAAARVRARRRHGRPHRRRRVRHPRRGRPRRHRRARDRAAGAVRAGGARSRWRGATSG